MAWGRLPHEFLKYYPIALVTAKNEHKKEACLRTFLEEIKQAKRILKKMTFFKNRKDFNKKVRRQAPGNQYQF